MDRVQRIGVIGLDTSHVEVFAQILNDPNHSHHIPGGRIAAAWPGGSPDFEFSISRVEGYTNTLRDDFGVDILESPEAVAEQSDLVFIETIDGRVHLDLFKRIAPYGKPVFIDKPLSAGLADAQAILALAREFGVPVMSCSSLRYADNLQAALADDEQGAITGCDVFGPMVIMPPLPALYWYGIHTVEMLVTALGTGCRQVRVVKNENNDIVTCEWGDGRMGVVRGARESHSRFGLTLHREQGVQALDISANERPYYASLIEVIMRNLPEGGSSIPDDQMLEVIRIIDAANESRETGQAVEIVR